MEVWIDEEIFLVGLVFVIGEGIVFFFVGGIMSRFSVFFYEWERGVSGFLIVFFFDLKGSF